MSPDLQEIRERLDYADSEIVAVIVDLQSYLSGATEIRRIAEINQNIIQVRIVKPVPIGLRIKVGSAIHEIRSCLEALTCRLAERNGNNANGVYFPIFKSKESFDAHAAKKLAKLSAKDRDAILSLKSDGDSSPLIFGMHDFDRQKKHNRIGITLAQSNKIMVHRPPGVEGSPLTMQWDLEELSYEWKTIVTSEIDDPVGVGVCWSINFLEPEHLKGLSVGSGLKSFLSNVRSVVDFFR